MKLLKKLLPLATVASTAAIVAPIVTSCSNGFNMVDISKEYTPTIAQYTPASGETEGVNATKALEIYLTEANKNKEIIVQDALWSVCGVRVPEGVKAQIGIKVNKIDTTNKTVDFEAQEHTEGKYTQDTESAEMNASTWLKVTNAKATMEYDNGVWEITLGTTNISDLGDSVITGKCTGYYKGTSGGKTTETTYTGKEITIKKDTVAPTEEKELAEFIKIFMMACEEFDSNFLGKLKFKA